MRELYCMYNTLLVPKNDSIQKDITISIQSIAIYPRFANKVKIDDHESKKIGRQANQSRQETNLRLLRMLCVTVRYVRPTTIIQTTTILLYVPNNKNQDTKTQRQNRFYAPVCPKTSDDRHRAKMRRWRDICSGVCN